MVRDVVRRFLDVHWLSRISQPLVGPPRSSKSFWIMAALWQLQTGFAGVSRLARAYALQGGTAKARAKYQDFLTLWKDADPDIPIFKQAKAEYAKVN